MTTYLMSVRLGPRRGCRRRLVDQPDLRVGHLTHEDIPCTFCAMDARYGRGMDVLVIGAGVSGLTTGICLAEAGLSVTIRAAVPPGQTTSVAAGAVWGLVRVGPPDRALVWGRAGLKVLSRLAAEPGTGVRMVRGREISRT